MYAEPLDIITDKFPFDYYYFSNFEEMFTFDGFFYLKQEIICHFYQWYRRKMLAMGGEVCYNATINRQGTAGYGSYPAISACCGTPV